MSHLLDPGDVGGFGAREVCLMCGAHCWAGLGQQRTEVMVQQLKQLHWDWQLAPVRDLLLFFLAGEDAWQRTVRIPIPAEFELDGGAVVTLVLQSRAGGLGGVLQRPTVHGFSSR
jgi:hypothetical protein